MWHPTVFYLLLMIWYSILRALPYTLSYISLSFFLRRFFRHLLYPRVRPLLPFILWPSINTHTSNNFLDDTVDCLTLKRKLAVLRRNEHKTQERFYTLYRRLFAIWGYFAILLKKDPFIVNCYRTWSNNCAALSQCAKHVLKTRADNAAPQVTFNRAEKVFFVYFSPFFYSPNKKKNHNPHLFEVPYPYY